MKRKKTIIISVILITTLLVLLIAAIAISNKLILIGRNDCGFYKAKNVSNAEAHPESYFATNCRGCLGKKVIEDTGSRFIQRTCIGIKFHQSYE